MSNTPVLSVAEHEARSAGHEAVGDALEPVNEWFAVCYFYAAYHLAKAALKADPIFLTLAAAQAVDPRLSVDSPLVEHHNGSGDRGPGVNDLVRIVYGTVLSRRYARLHSASVGVRYGRGHSPVAASNLVADLGALKAAYFAGELVHR